MSSMRGAEAGPGMMDVPGGKNWRAVFWDGVRERGDAPVGKIEEGVCLFLSFFYVVSFSLRGKENGS